MWNNDATALLLAYNTVARFIIITFLSWQNIRQQNTKLHDDKPGKP